MTDIKKRIKKEAVKGKSKWLKNARDRRVKAKQMETHKGLKERRNITLSLEKDFADWLVNTHCSCLVAYYNLSVREIRQFYYKWVNAE